MNVVTHTSSERATCSSSAERCTASSRRLDEWVSVPSRAGAPFVSLTASVSGSAAEIERRETRASAGIENRSVSGAATEYAAACGTATTTVASSIREICSKPRGVAPPSSTLFQPRTSDCSEARPARSAALASPSWPTAGSQLAPPPSVRPITCVSSDRMSARVARPTNEPLIVTWPASGRSRADSASPSTPKVAVSGCCDATRAGGTTSVSVSGSAVA